MDTTLQAVYPLVLVDDLQAIRRFYREVLQAELVFDLPHYVQVKVPCIHAPELAFALASSLPNDDHAAQRKTFAGHGLILSMQVDDVDAHHRHIAARLPNKVQPPADRPWKWRSYAIVDPSGALLDFYTPIAQSM